MIYTTPDKKQYRSSNTNTHATKVEIKFSAHEQFLELPSTLSKGCFKNNNMII